MNAGHSRVLVIAAWMAVPLVAAAVYLASVSGAFVYDDGSYCLRTQTLCCSASFHDFIPYFLTLPRLCFAVL